MSVIAAKVINNSVLISADSILVKGWSRRNTNFSKLISVNNMIIGGTGNAEEISLMWIYANTHKPADATEQDILTFVTEFAQWKTKMSVPTVENSYLICYKGHLFEVEHLFVHEIFDYVAIGAGEDFATAALYLGRNPHEAVKVACDLSCMVCEPIIDLSQEKE